MRYIESLAVWLGFITEAEAEHFRKVREYKKRMREILRVPRVDMTPLSVLESGNNTE